jgi:2-polyprenyl-6-methoxyphenol hydroxylase-like FAD-dependent oxidoreductase
LPHLKREITIAGGGLAGLSLAIALRQRDVPVVVLEAGSYPRHRVCGEFISGVKSGTLDNLGIAGIFEGALQHRTLAWHDQGDRFYQGTLPEPALGISRLVLDERLMLLFESLGGILRTAMRARPDPQEGFVWAAGRRATKGRWLGLKAHIRALPMNADLEMHLGTNGYAGLAGIEDDWINVCGLFKINRTIDAKSQDLLPAYLEAGGNIVLAELLRRADWREGSFSAVAGFELGRQPAIPGLVCLGDAESMIPPFTGNGMSMAFQSAESSIDPLLAWAESSVTWEAAKDRIASALRQRFKRRLATAGLFNHVLLHSSGRKLLRSLSAAHLLPFRPALSLVR